MTRYIFSFIFLAVVWSDVAWTAVYYWEDNEGNAHYSDQVPPEHSKYRRERLNRHGRTVKILKRAKTPEEIEQEKRLKKLRAEEKRLLAEQRTHDKALLRTFRSEKDIAAALQGKLKTIDVFIKVTEANRSRLKNQLDELLKQAAALDRNGKNIPKKLVESIRATQRQIAENQQTIDNQAQEKQRLRDQSARDLRRFRKLTAATGSGTAASPTTDEPDAGTDKAIKGNISLINCTNAAQCDKAWELARNYIEQHSTTALQIDTDHILMTADPRTETDISLTVSRIPGERSGAQLFLSVRCKRSGMGRELCAGAEARRIRSGFRPFVEADLGSTP